MSRLILDLCAGTGAWSEPYRDAGYEVVRVDIGNGDDVRLCRITGAHGILAAVDCTHFARVGARWWKEKGTPMLLEGLSIADACMRIIWANQKTLEWWALENPIGRLQDYYGPPVYKFDPWWFGDPWTKRTWLWGEFTIPQAHCAQRPVLVGKPRSRDRTSLMSSSWKKERSRTPPGFARAFFEANP